MKKQLLKIRKSNTNRLYRSFNLGFILCGLLSWGACKSNANNGSQPNPQGLDSASYYNEKGLGESSKENYEEAIKYFDIAIGFDSTFSKAYNNKGSVLQTLDLNDQAIVEFNAAIKLEPFDGLLYHNRGRSKEYLGNWIGACEDWNRAAKLGFVASERYLELFCR